MTNQQRTWSSPTAALLVLLLALGCERQSESTELPEREFRGSDDSHDDPQPISTAGDAVAATSAVFDPAWHHAVTAAIANDQYLPHRVRDGFLARNVSHDLEARFSSTGVELARDDGPPVFVGGASLSVDGNREDLEPGALRLDSCVKGPILDASGRCLPALRGERGSVSEVWENRPDGLEHTFVVRGATSGVLELDVRITGARVVVGASGEEAELIQDDGGLSLRYSALAAWDAGGKVLPAHLQAWRDGLSLVVDAREAQFPVVIDPLLTDVEWSAESNQARAYFGDAISDAGDVNQDGYGDVIIGAPYFDAATPDSGRAYLYFGNATGLETTAAWTASGDLEDSNFGDAVAGVGDVDQDGYDDVVVSAPRRDNAPGQGRVYLYRGGPSGPSLTADWFASSVLPAELYGYAVAGAGDVNGDDFADVVIGARAFYDGQSNEGRAIAFFGSASGLAATPDWEVQSNQSGALLGDAVSGAGDVNDDGFDDVIVGARNFDNGQTNEGAAFVYHGSSSGLSATAAWSAESNQVGALFGSAVLGGGDVNGDGYDDVVVSAPNYDQVYSDEGAVFLYLGGASGLALDAAWSKFGDQAGAHFGEGLAFGDVQADGRADLLVGAPDWDEGLGVDNGRAYLFGGHTGASGLLESPSWTATGESSDDQLGSAIAGLDANADGRGDVVVGAWTYDVGQDDEGGAFAHLGQAPVPFVGRDVLPLFAALLLCAGVLTVRRQSAGARVPRMPSRGTPGTRAG